MSSESQSAMSDVDAAHADAHADATAQGRTRRVRSLSLLAASAGSLLAMFGSRRPWQPVAGQKDLLRGVVVPAEAPTGVIAVTSIAGACVALAVIVCGPRLRRGISVLAALTGLAGMASAVAYSRGSAAQGQAVPLTTLGLTVSGCLLVVIAGALIAIAQPTWQGLSSRYERTEDPKARERELGSGINSPDEDPWRALDAGVDPTL